MRKQFLIICYFDGKSEIAGRASSFDEAKALARSFQDIYDELEMDGSYHTVVHEDDYV